MLLDELQYGADLADLAARGKGPLPVADYRLAHQCVGPGARGKQESDEDSDGDGDGDGDGPDAAYEKGNTKESSVKKSKKDKKDKKGKKKKKGGTGGGGWDQQQQRACYSFCMCPGGQIVPTSTDVNELCVNGMSFSKRSSAWANSGLAWTSIHSRTRDF